MNWLDWAIVLLVVAWLVGSLLYQRRHKKSGGCCGDCSQCNMGGNCREKKNLK